MACEMNKEIAKDGIEWSVQYDAVCSLYTHPRQISALAIALGHTPPPIETARILELGCATGGNLTPIAASLPNSYCVGIDPFKEQIVNAQQRAEASQINNVKYLPIGVSDFEQLDGPFDFIIAHGLYSWISDEHRADTLTLCRHLLSPQGLAYLSYNTYPHWHIEQANRSLLRWRYRQLSEKSRQEGKSVTDEEMVKSSRELLKVYSHFAKHTDQVSLRKIYERCHTRLQQLPDWYLIHEYLLEHNRAFHFEELVSTAEDAGLSYLGDVAPNTELAPSMLSNQLLRELEYVSNDRVGLHQATDMIVNRGLRRSIFRRNDAGASLRSIKDNQTIWTSSSLIEQHGELIFFSSAYLPQQDDFSDITQPMSFLDQTSGHKPVTYTTRDLYENALLILLGASWPNELPIRSILDQTKELINTLCPSHKVNQTLLEKTFSYLIYADIISTPSLGKMHQSEESLHQNPTTLPHLRHRYVKSGSLTNRVHRSSFTSDALLWLIPLLDGSRELSQLQALKEQSSFSQTELSALLDEARTKGLLS